MTTFGRSAAGSVNTDSTGMVRTRAKSRGGFRDFEIAHRGQEPLTWVGRDSVEPTFERSEANKVSIFPFQNGDRDARFARASCVGRMGSTESLPTHLWRFIESEHLQNMDVNR